MRDSVVALFAEALNAAAPLCADIDVHDLSKKIGGPAALVLIGLIVWLILRRGKTKP